MLTRLICAALTSAFVTMMLVMSLPASAEGASPLSALAGSWKGSGTLRFEGGQSERIKCRGYYTAIGGSGLGLALRCASPSAKIDLRSSLQYRAGRVSGTWEERSFNASGNVSGRASSGQMSLAVNGGGLAGSMSVSFSGSQQSVSISTSGTGLKGVHVNLRRG